jgi:hypothetical protein
MFNAANFDKQWWWQGISTFLGCPPARNPAEADIGMVGIPHCGGNPITRMQYLAPREATASASTRSRCAALPLGRR